MYLVKRAWNELVISLIRISGQRQEMWTVRGWEPYGLLEWTGIGGSVDWDEID